MKGSKPGGETGCVPHELINWHGLTGAEPVGHGDPSAPFTNAEDAPGDLIGFVYGGDVGVRYGGSGTDRVEKLGTPLRIGLGPDDPDQDRSVESSVHA